MQTITRHSLENTLYYRHIPVFKYSIGFPSFVSSCSEAATQTINAHYASLALEQKDDCRTVLYPQAVKDAQYIQSNEPPFHPYEFIMDYQVTFNSGCMTSLYFDRYTFMGGAHGSRERTSDTWDFSSGRKILLGDFFPSEPGYEAHLTEWIIEQTALRLIAEPASFFNDYADLIRKNFRPESFYRTPEALVLYFQEYDIAPYTMGIPEFSLPILN